jgi:hypothetical protein
MTDTFPAKPGSLGVHSDWNVQPGDGIDLHWLRSPAIMVEAYDDTIFVEVRNAEGYTFVDLSPTQARALGVALIKAAALQERNSR